MGDRVGALFGVFILFQSPLHLLLVLVAIDHVEGALIFVFVP